MLMLECVVVVALQLVEQVCGGGGCGDGRPHRHRVDQQAHHRFRAGHLGWPPRNRGAEGDIMLAGQPAQQLRPGALQHRADGGVARARQLAKGPRGLLRHPKRFHASPPQPQPARRTHQGRGVKTGQHLTPGRAGGLQVSIGQPGHKPAIRCRRSQPLPVIAGEDFLQQDRQRPAIGHDVVISEYKPVPIFCGADQNGPKRRLLGQIAHRGAFASTHPLDLLIDITIGGVELDIPPRRHRISRDDLHRLIELLTESGHQVRMPTHHRVHRLTQPVRVQRAAQRDIQLHRIHIVVAILRGAGVKQQSPLQRGQRQNIGDLIALAQLVDLRLAQDGRARYPRASTRPHHRAHARRYRPGPQTTTGSPD